MRENGIQRDLCAAGRWIEKRFEVAPPSQRRSRQLAKSTFGADPAYHTALSANPNRICAYTSIFKTAVASPLIPFTRWLRPAHYSLARHQYPSYIPPIGTHATPSGVPVTATTGVPSPQTHFKKMAESEHEARAYTRSLLNST